MTVYSANGIPLKAIGLKKAMEIMHLTGTRLVKMYSPNLPEGFAHYIVPGGYVEPGTAEKIKAHAGVVASEDGLFPGQDQTWKMDTT